MSRNRYRSTFQLILDLQYGSTGKGLIAGVIAQKWRPHTVVTAWAANAGHTFINSMTGRKYVHTMLANSVVSPDLETLLLGPGSLIDPDALLREMEECEDLLRGVEILIHPHAAVITQQHRDLEAGPMTKIGSTKKGVGEAAIQRIRRDPDNQNVARILLKGTALEQYVCSTPAAWTQMLGDAGRVLIEGAQGYSLSMYHGFYPYCTSRDVSTAQILADCGIPMGLARNRLHVVGTARTYPIRVANRFDTEGQQVGWSGPCYHDQREIQWEDLGMQAELTTVTKLPRRIFTFSGAQIAEALQQNGVDEVFLNFANYCKDEAELNRIIACIESCERWDGDPIPVKWLGFGPTDADVYDTASPHDVLRMDEGAVYRDAGKSMMQLDGAVL